MNAKQEKEVGRVEIFNNVEYMGRREAVLWSHGCLEGRCLEVKLLEGDRGGVIRIIHREAFEGGSSSNI